MIPSRTPSPPPSRTPPAPVSAPTATAAEGGVGPQRKVRAGDASHRRTPYDRPAPTSAAAEADTGTGIRTRSRARAEMKSEQSAPASASRALGAAPAPAPDAPQSAPSLEAAARAALDASTFPQVPWGSDEWRAARAERRAALRAWYLTCPAAKRRLDLSQAFEIRTFPTQADAPVAHEQARAVRLTQMEVLIELMSAEDRARNLASAKTEAALPGGDCPLPTFEKSRALYRLHLMAHHELMTPGQRRASWAEATDMEHLCAPVSFNGSQRRWKTMREVPVQVAHAYLPDEDRARVHWDLLDPTPFVQLGWGRKPSVTDFRRRLWAWEQVAHALPLQVQLDIVFGAIATATPTCGVPASDDAGRLVRHYQIESLIDRNGPFTDPENRRRFRHWISLPPFAPGETHWEFGAALRATAAYRIYNCNCNSHDEALAEWSALLGALELPPAPRDAVARPNAMRQRLDHIAIIATYERRRPGAPFIEPFWNRTRDASTLPPRETAPQAWRDVLALRAFALEQLRPRVGAALREASLARLGGLALPSPATFATDPQAVGDDPRVLDVLGAIVLTQDPQATPSLSQRLLGTNYGQRIGGVVWRVARQDVATVPLREESDWPLPDLGVRLPKAD